WQRLDGFDSVAGNAGVGRQTDKRSLDQAGVGFETRIELEYIFAAVSAAQGSLGYVAWRLAVVLDMVRLNQARLWRQRRLTWLTTEVDLSNGRRWCGWCGRCRWRGRGRRTGLRGRALVCQRRQRSACTAHWRRYVDCR